jgi:hypothetical protein
MRPHRTAEHLRRRLADRAVVVVSPHLDDAGVSAWWLLSQLDDVHVVTVFTAPALDGAPSYWDRQLGFSSSDEAIEVRLAEDRRAIGLTNASSSYLDLRELEYRTSDDEAVVTEQIAEGVADLVSGGSAVTLVLPGALGRRAGPVRRRRDRSRIPLIRTAPGNRPHRDHLLVRDALLGWSRSSDVEVAFYEDLPYARSGGRPELRRAATHAGLDVGRIAVPVDLPAKEQVVRAYASQYETFLPTWARRFDQAFAPVEHLWWPRPTPG